VDEKDKQIAELEQALRDLLAAADGVAFTECPFSTECDAYNKAREKAEATLRR
jgi:hypothetical protein